MSKPMTTDEFREALDIIGWSQKDCAREAGRDISVTHKMARGRVPIDEPFAEWLRAFVSLYRSPPPKPCRRPHNEPNAKSEPQTVD
jgi:hypothetical protein